LDSTQVINAEKRFTAENEQEWIALVQKGNQPAFLKIYQLYHKKIYAHCWRMLADKESAEDVCQEVFVQVWKKINLFRGDSKFSTWLYSVATNVVLGHLRKQKNWWQNVFSIEDNVVEEPTEDMNELSELDKHIMKLPERARHVFVLFAVEGYRHEEIAKMLNMAVGSSKAQYHRARQLLKEWVSE